MLFFVIPNGSKQTMTFWTRWSNLLYFPRGPLKWLTAAKNANVSWLLNFKIRMFLKSAVSNKFKHFFCFSFISGTFGSKQRTFSNSIVKKTWLRYGHFVPNKHARISPEHQLTNWSAMSMCVIVKLQARDTIDIHCIQLACLVNVCYAYWPEMYWHVFTSGDLYYCFLVDAIVYFSTLSNVSRGSFPYFNLL